MSTSPHENAERSANDALRHPHDEEVLPFDASLACPTCGGDMEVLQITTRRHGKVIVATMREIALCPRCQAGKRR